MRLPLITLALAFSSLALGADYNLTNLGWSGATGNTSSVPGALALNVDDDSANIVVRCAATGPTRYAQANWNVEVEWKATSTSEPVPTSLQIEVGRSSVLTSAGDGWCTVEAGSVLLDRINSQDYFFSGFFTYLPQTTHIAPVLLNSSGKYVASFSVPSNLITTKFNSLSSTVSKAEEHLTILEFTAL